MYVSRRSRRSSKEHNLSTSRQQSLRDNHIFLCCCCTFPFLHMMLRCRNLQREVRGERGREGVGRTLGAIGIIEIGSTFGAEVSSEVASADAHSWVHAISMFVACFIRTIYINK